MADEEFEPEELMTDLNYVKRFAGKTRAYLKPFFSLFRVSRRPDQIKHKIRPKQLKPMIGLLVLIL